MKIKEYFKLFIYSPTFLYIIHIINKYFIGQSMQSVLLVLCNLVCKLHIIRTYRIVSYLVVLYMVKPNINRELFVHMTISIILNNFYSAMGKNFKRDKKYRKKLTNFKNKIIMI